MDPNYFMLLVYFLRFPRVVARFVVVSGDWFILDGGPSSDGWLLLLLSSRPSHIQSLS